MSTGCLQIKVPVADIHVHILRQITTCPWNGNIKFPWNPHLRYRLPIAQCCRSDVKPLSLLTGGICDSGRNALTDISRGLPSDDIVHGINSLLWQWRRRLQWRPLLGAPAGPQWCASGAFSSVSAAVAPLGPGTRRHKYVPARHSDGMSRPAWMIG